MLSGPRNISPSSMVVAGEWFPWRQFTAFHLSPTGAEGGAPDTWRDRRDRAGEGTTSSRQRWPRPVVLGPVQRRCLDHRQSLESSGASQPAAYTSPRHHPERETEQPGRTRIEPEKPAEQPLDRQHLVSG